MTQPYSLVNDLMDAAPPEKGILSRTLHGDDQVKVVLFHFAAGEELSEHTASVPAVLHFLSGKARVTLGETAVDAGPGTWVHMAAHLTHGIQARTPVVMLLTMLKAGKS